MGSIFYKQQKLPICKRWSRGNVKICKYKLCRNYLTYIFTGTHQSRRSLSGPLRHILKMALAKELLVNLFRLKIFTSKFISIDVSSNQDSRSKSSWHSPGGQLKQWGVAVIPCGSPRSARRNWWTQHARSPRACYHHPPEKRCYLLPSTIVIISHGNVVVIFRCLLINESFHVITTAMPMTFWFSSLTKIKN